MKRLNLIFIWISFIVALFTFPTSANAVTISRPANYNVPFTLGQLFDRGISWFIVITIAFSVVMFIRGAWDYASAGDEADKIEGARNSLTNAVVGVVLVMVIFAIIFAVNTLLGTSIEVGLPFS